MSKAFVREDENDEDDLGEEEQPKTPSGKNYISPGGFRRLVDELNYLQKEERPKVTDVVAWAASNGDRSENADYQYGKRRLREIDRRIRFLSKRIDSAEVVEIDKIVSDQVLFGATVTFRDEDDVEKTYTIVGVDEIDVDKGRISWVSPLASALFKGREGDWVTVRTPKGPKDVEIVSIRYIAFETEDFRKSIENKNTTAHLK